jgi:hypothetical protein
MQHVVREPGRMDWTDSHVEATEDIAKLCECHCHRRGLMSFPSYGFMSGCLRTILTDDCNSTEVSHPRTSRKWWYELQLCRLV